MRLRSRHLFSYRPCGSASSSFISLKCFVTGIFDVSWLHTVGDLLWNPCLDLLLVFVAVRLGSMHYLLICQSCHFCLIVLFPGISSPVPLHVSLSSRLSLHLSPLSSTPSQDKQPLFWGMSAICSKKLTRSWMLISIWVSNGRETFKILCFHILFFSLWSMLHFFLQLFPQI